MPRGQGSGKTVDEAVNDYDENASADAWSAGISEAAADNNYSSGIASFLGISQNQIRGDADSSWEETVNNAAARRNYEQNTDGEAWAEAYGDWARDQ